MGILRSSEIVDRIPVNPGDRLISMPASSKGNTVAVSSYDTGDVGQLFSRNGVRTFLFGGHTQRLRASGSITSITIWTNTLTNITSVVLRVMRRNTVDDNWDQVPVDSANILGSLTGGGAWDTIPVGTLWPGGSPACRAGDCIAVAITATDADAWMNCAQNLDAEDRDVLYHNGDIAGADQTFGLQMGTGGYSAYCYVNMDSPILMFGGDSFMAGAADCTSPIEALGDGLDWKDVEFDVPTSYHLSQIDSTLFGSYMNHAVRGSTSTTWANAANFATYVSDYTPRACVFSLGYNDVMDSASWATFIGNIATIVQRCALNEIVPIFITILQAQSGTAAQQATIAEWNRGLTRWCAERGILCLDAYSILALQGAPEGRNTALFGSETHPNSAGYKAIATALATRIQSLQ